MQRKLFKELWTLRFEKILEIEKQALQVYGALLKDCKTHYQDEAGLQKNFESLIQDEKRHVLLVQELLDIVCRQAD